MNKAVKLHELNHAIATEMGVTIANGEVDLIHNLTIGVDVMKEDIPLSAKLIADELKSRISSLTGVKLLPDFIGRNKYKVLVSN